jgi:hypothetical protein
MRVFVKIKPTKKGYEVYNKAMVKIATIDRLNLVDAYRTRKKGQAMLCGSYEPYSEMMDAYYKLDDIDNLALDTVVLTGYDVHCNPLGTLLQKENS